jgi:hypothetical protein
MQVDSGLSEPLSWEEARSRLRKLLETYVKDPPPPNRPSADITTETVLSKWISRDLDLYFGALAFSIALLALSFFSLSAKWGNVGESALRPTASEGVYKSQVVASLLLVAGSCASTWMVRRRGFLSLNDTDYSKRREIIRFLRSPIFQKSSLGSSQSVPASSQVEDSPSWTQIPSLLLVRGDYIALQIGDIAPANCVMVHSDEITVRVAVGERLNLDNADQLLADLPRGRTTIAPDSELLLTLCNRTRVFLVLDTPLEEFIYRPSGKYDVLFYRNS